MLSWLQHLILYRGYPEELDHKAPKPDSGMISLFAQPGLAIQKLSKSKENVSSNQRRKLCQV